MKRLLGLLLLAIVSSCDPPATAGPRPEVLAALGQAKAYHHLADVYLDDGRPGEAIAALEKILEIPFPPGATDGADAVLDARARLGKLLLGVGRLDDAGRIVEEGVRGARGESFFLANLYTVAGELHEARARLPGADAAAERRRAIESYGRSIEINQRIQKQLAEGSP